MTTDAARGSFTPEVVAAMADTMVGRRSEIEIVVAALAAGRHLLLEGPPGTGKSSLLRSLAQRSGIPMIFVEGNAELTPARLIGTFDPARVLDEGYDPEVFLDGPLTEALRLGAVLYIEEINRVPEETLNVVITAMSERELHVPRLGSVAAAPGFRVVAAMNPFDAIGTARISSAVYDRVCRIAMSYQSLEEEYLIVAREGGPRGAGPLGRRAVRVTRATRNHPDLRIGASVRGAIDLALLGEELSVLRGIDAVDEDLGRDAARAALSGRIRVREGTGVTAEEIIDRLWSESSFDEPAHSDRAGSEGDPGKV